MPKSEARSFKYKPRSYQKSREMADSGAQGFDTIFKPKFKKYKIKDGKNIIRILPPTWEEAEHFGLHIHVNYGIGPDKQTYLSLSKMKDEADPIDEARREAQREDDDDLAKSLAPRKRAVMWIIDRMDEEEGPQLFDAPMTIDTGILNLVVDDDTKEVIPIDDPKEGSDFRFYKTGKGLNTDYDGSKMRVLAPSPLSKDKEQADEWMAFVVDNPIPDCLQYYSYDHINKVFSGAAAKKKAGDDDEDDAPPAKGRKQPPAEEDEEPPRRSRRTEPADEEEEAPARGKRKPAEEDDEPAERPRRSRAPVDEEEDEPAPRSKRRADPDDEDDEPPPRSKRKPADDDDDPPFEADDEPKSGKGGSIRDRLAARKKASNQDDD